MVDLFSKKKQFSRTAAVVGTWNVITAKGFVCSAIIVDNYHKVAIFSRIDLREFGHQPHRRDRTEKHYYFQGIKAPKSQFIQSRYKVSSIFIPNFSQIGSVVAA